MKKTRSRAPGTLITFEGTEGAGKSTLIEALKLQLESHGYDVVSTREPGGSRVAEQIRQVILENEMNRMTELFLYEAARAEHYTTTIAPAIKRGAIVLCDRYIDSTFAYQGAARGIPDALIAKLNDIATEKTLPRFTVFLDVDPEAGLKSATNPNRFEREGTAFQEKVRRGFLKQIRKNPKRFIKLRAKQFPAETMAEKLIARLKLKPLKTKMQARR